MQPVPSAPWSRTVAPFQECPTQPGTCSEEEVPPTPLLLSLVQLNLAGFSDKVKFQQCRISCSRSLKAFENFGIM